MIKKPPYLLIGIMMLGTLVTILNSSSLNIALPLIMVDLDIAHYSTIQWLTTINMLIAGILIPTSAFFITKFKSHYIFVCAIGVFTIGSFLAFIAPNFSFLIVARILQASATAILIPLLMNVMLASFSREERGKAMGIFGMVYMTAPALSPLLAGFVLNYFSWREVFLLITIISSIPLILGVFKLKNVLEQKETMMDFTSLLFSSVGFTALLLGLNQAEIAPIISFQVGGLILIGITSLTFFVKRQFKVETPLIDLKVYNYSMFALASAISVLIALLIYAPMIIMPFYLQNVRNYSPLVSGLIPMPGTLILALAMPITGKWYDKVGARNLAIIGFSLVSIGTFALSRLTLETTTFYVIFFMAIRSFGFSFVLMPMQTNGLNQLPSRLNAAGTAVNSTVQQVAGAIGIVLFVNLKTGVINSRLPAIEAYQGELFEMALRHINLEAINFTFFISGFLATVAFICSLFVKKIICKED